MDVRAKLVEILRKPIFPHELVDPIEAVADYLLDSGVTVQEWISVYEPPKKNGYYLVYTKSGEIIRGYYKGCYWLVGIDVVTHWQPMPQPPKGE